MTDFDTAAHPRVPDSGRFANKGQTAPEAALRPYTRKAPPLPRLSLDALDAPASQYIDNRDDYDLNPPYQRGSVWTLEQRMNLIRSMLMRLPIGSITVNHRGYFADALFAVVDGKQRIEAIRAFADNEFAVPRDWFEDKARTGEEGVEHDGDEVVFSDLSLFGRRQFRKLLVPTTQASVGTVAEEAELFGLLNGGGTPQTAESMAVAEAVARF